MEYLNKMMHMVMFKHTIFSLPFILIAMIVAAGGWFGFTLLALAAFELFTARNFAMAVNRYVDRDIDKKNPRTENRPSVDGSITEWEMIGFIVGNGLMFVGVSYLINPLAFALSIPILFILGIYSYFKRFSAYAHIILGISLALAPIAGAIAVLGTIPAWSVFLALGVAFWVAGFDILYSLQDMDFDKKNGLFSIPSKYGKETSLLISKLFHLLTIIFWVLFSAFSGVGFLGWIAVAISAFILYKEHQIIKENEENIPKAFFDYNGYLGIIYMSLIILDKLF